MITPKLRLAVLATYARAARQANPIRPERQATAWAFRLNRFRIRW
jgi:hypothetical protein